MLIKTNRFRLVHASTTRAVETRRSKPAYPVSTCFNEVSPRRKNIVGRIFVAVMLCSALWASPLPYAEGESFYGVPAAGAAFAGGKESIHQDQLFPVTGTLIPQHRTKRSERSIGQRLGETMILNHSPDVQIFDADAVVTAHQISRHLVEVIFSGVADMFLNPGNSDALPIPPATTFYTAGQNSLSLSKSSLVFARMLRVRDSFSVTGSSQSVYPEIYTYRFPGKMLLLESFVQTQRDKVTSAGSFGDSDGSGVGFEFPTPVYVEASESADNQIRIVRVGPGELESRGSILGRLFVSLLLESGVSTLLLKETDKSVVQVSEGLLSGDTGNFVEPSSFFFSLPLGEFGGSIVVTDPLLSFLPSISPIPQRPVIDVAAAAEDLGKLGLLGLCRINPELVSNLHTYTSVYVRVFVNNKNAQRGAIPPTAKAVGFLAQTS